MKSYMTVLFVLAISLTACRSREFEITGYTVAEVEDRVVVAINGEPFTEYRFANEPRPILYPLFGPGGVPLTRDYPMVEGTIGEAEDHPHHQSLWFAHGDVNGFDFWHGTDAGERIVHDRFLGISWLGDRAEVRARNLWQVGEGRTICVEERTMTFGFDERGRVIDFTYQLSPTDEPLVFGDTKEGTMALRLAPALRLKGEVAEGKCLNAAGDTGGDCWGKRAAWVTYYGPVAGRLVSVTLLDHPENPRHPTWWHARDYGLFAANPFGVHDFEGQPAGTGDLRVELGESLTLRYRLRIATGAPDPDELNDELKRFAR